MGPAAPVAVVQIVGFSGAPGRASRRRRKPCERPCALPTDAVVNLVDSDAGSNAVFAAQEGARMLRAAILDQHSVGAVQARPPGLKALGFKV